jgi:EpsI family protein
LTGQATTSLATPFGDLRMKRLNTQMGRDRVEPVTYWIVIGQHVALNGYEKRVAELKHSLKGEIVDGVLFRISTIDSNTARAHAIQDGFTKDLLHHLAPENRLRLSGLK